MSVASIPPPSGSSLTQVLSQCREKPLIFDGVRPELCGDLEKCIIRRMDNDRGRRVGSLNVGGWKSSEDFFLWSDDAVQELHSTIAALVGTSSLVAWAMLNRAGSHHPRHQHRAALVSGVYYVSPGDATEVTPTIFECPCDDQLARSVRPYELKVDPHPGRLVLCRGSTWHRVPQYLGNEPRITIVFDVRR